MAAVQFRLTITVEKHVKRRKHNHVVVEVYAVDIGIVELPSLILL